MAVATDKQSARRTIRLLWILQGHTFEGLRLKQIGEALETTPSTALRDLEMLASEGVTERIPGRDDFWRLTPKLIQLSRAHEIEMQRLRDRVDEIDKRYTRSF